MYADINVNVNTYIENVHFQEKQKLTFDQLHDILAPTEWLMKSFWFYFHFLCECISFATQLIIHNFQRAWNLPWECCFSAHSFLYLSMHSSFHPLIRATSEFLLCAVAIDVPSQWRWRQCLQFVEHVFYAKRCAKCFTSVLVNLHNIPVR